MNAIIKLFNDISDNELLDAISEIRESDKTGFITDGVVRKYARLSGEITGGHTTTDFHMVQINLLKEAAFRWSKNKYSSETNTFITEGLSSKPLPKNSIVEFRVEDTLGNLENKVSVYVKKDGTIDVHADSRDGSRFVIAPRAANAAMLMFVPES